MKKHLLLLAAALLPALASAQWRDAAGNAAPDLPFRKASGEFGAQLILTANATDFRAQWNMPTPRLTTTDNAKVGGSISAVLVFFGCKAAPDGNCKVTADFELQQPGGMKLPATKGPVWSAKPPGRGIFMLGDVSATIDLGPNDAPGVYTLTANVTDQVANKTLQLSAPFTVVK